MKPAKDMHGIEIGAGDVVIADGDVGIVMSIRPCNNEAVDWQWVTVRVGKVDVEYSSFSMQVRSKAFDFVEQVRLAAECDKDASVAAVLDSVCNQLRELREWRSETVEGAATRLVRLSLIRTFGSARRTAEELKVCYRLVRRIADEMGIARRKLPNVKSAKNRVLQKAK